MNKTAPKLTVGWGNLVRAAAATSAFPWKLAPLHRRFPRCGDPGRNRRATLRGTPYCSAVATNSMIQSNSPPRYRSSIKMRRMRGSSPPLTGVRVPFSEGRAGARRRNPCAPDQLVSSRSGCPRPSVAAVAAGRTASLHPAGGIVSATQRPLAIRNDVLDELLQRGALRLSDLFRDDEKGQSEMGRRRAPWPAVDDGSRGSCVSCALNAAMSAVVPAGEGCTYCPAWF